MRALSTNSAEFRGVARVVVLGHGGFIGTHLARFFREQSPEIEVLGHALPTIDLSRLEDTQKLEDFFDSQTAVLMCAAIKRQLGDTLDTFSQNMSMAANLCRLLQKHPIRRFVFFSSAAVYGEERTNLHISEDTPVQPTSYYGAAKFACECIFRQVVSQLPECSLLVLRPALIYGPGDQGGYGPTGFIKAALGGEQIVLWGDGSEKREFVYVGDVLKIVHALTFHQYDGVLNVVSGTSYAFKDALNVVERLVPLEKPIGSRPRTKNKADHGFDNSRLRGLLPDLKFTKLAEGMRLTAESFRDAIPSSHR
jgi:UDP-glucose 4-epimerase